MCLVWWLSSLLCLFQCHFQSSRWTISLAALYSEILLVRLINLRLDEHCKWYTITKLQNSYPAISKLSIKLTIIITSGSTATFGLAFRLCLKKLPRRGLWMGTRIWGQNTVVAIALQIIISEITFIIIYHSVAKVNENDFAFLRNDVQCFYSRIKRIEHSNSHPTFMAYESSKCNILNRDEIHGFFNIWLNGSYKRALCAAHLQTWFLWVWISLCNSSDEHHVYQRLSQSKG